MIATDAPISSALTLTPENSLIAFDIDGTLMGKSGSISKELQASVKKLQRRGFNFVLASGRPLATVEKVAKQLDIVPYCSAAENGGEIRFAGDSVKSIPNGHLKIFRDNIAGVHLPHHTIEPKHSMWSGHFGCPDRQRMGLRQIEGLITGLRLDLQVIAYSDYTWGIDVLCPGVTKADVLTCCPPQYSLVYFGDGLNDIPIMKEARVKPHAVGNACPEVKRLVTSKGGLISPLSDGSGVVDLLGRLFDLN